MELAKYHCTEGEQRQGDVVSACRRYSLGRAMLMRTAEDAGAIVRVGRRVVINYAVLDMYFDNISGA